jgi:transcriptional regulator with XRE-family HTH domain
VVSARRTWRSEARSRPDLQPTLRKLGRRVRELRAQRELTQEELGRLAQLDPKHVQVIEAGGSNVTVSTLLGIAEALGCGIPDLFRSA